MRYSPRGRGSIPEFFRRALLLSLPILACSAAGAAAQETTPTPPTAILREALDSEWHVRARLRADGRAEGRVESVGDGIAVIDGTEVALREIVLLERRRADQGDTVKGAKIGAGAGALAGLLLVPLCDMNGDCPEGRFVVGSALVGAFLGAVTGGLVSIGETEWVELWRAGR